MKIIGISHFVVYLDKDELLKPLGLKMGSFLKLLFDCFDSTESISSESRSTLLDRSHSNDMFFRKLDFDDKNDDDEFISFKLLNELFDVLSRPLLLQFADLPFTPGRSFRKS